MSGGVRDPQRRAHRFLRLYPRAWRERYGEEFEQLLVADIEECPRSPSRTLDVLWSGSLARLGEAGLASNVLDPARQLRAGVAAIGYALCLFLTFGVGIWSQLTIDWQWSAPAAGSTRTGMLMMSAVLAGFVVLLALAAVPVVWTVIRTVVQGRDAGLLVRVAVGLLALAVLVVGSVHIGHRWPGTGGHPWSGRDIVPGSVARFGWAATLSVTSYWAHPGALQSFPASEVAWMLVSPLALLTALIAGGSAVRRARPSGRLLRYELSLGVALVGAMAVFLAGAGSWVVGAGAAPRGPFRVGMIDAVGITVMGVALSLAFVAARRSVAANPGGWSAG